jgi:hypothetical protein
MADIAELGVKVTSEGIKETTDELGLLASEAERAEKRAASLARSQARMGETSSEAASSGGALSSALAKVESSTVAATAAGFVFGTLILKLGEGFFRLAKEVITAGDALQTLADKTDMSVQELQKWEYVGKQVGVSSQQLTMAIQMLQQRLGDTADGTGRAAKALETLGITQQQLQAIGNDNNALMELFVAKLGGVENASKRAALANDLFGRSAREFAPLFKMTAADLERLTSEFDNMGMAMSDRLTKASDVFTDSMYALGRGIMGTTYPAIEAVIVPLSTFAEWMRKSASESQVLVGLGSSLGLVFTGLMIPVKAVAAALIAVGAVLEQIGIGIAGLIFAAQRASAGALGEAKDALNYMVDQMSAAGDRGTAAIKKLWGGDDGGGAGKAKTEVDLVAAAYDKLAPLIEKTSNNSKDYVATLEALSIVRANWKGSDQEYIRLVEAIIAKQPGATAMLKEHRDALTTEAKAKRENATATRELEAAHKAAVGRDVKVAGIDLKKVQDAIKEIDRLAEARAKDAMEAFKQAKASEEMVGSIEFEIAKLKGLVPKWKEYSDVLLENATEMLRVERAHVAMFAPHDEYITKLDAQISANERLLAARQRLGELQETVDAAKKVEAQWRDTANNIEQALTNALVQSWEKGRSFLRSVGDYIVNYFKVTVAQNISKALMGAMGSLASGAASAMGGGGGGGGLSGMFSNVLGSVGNSMLTNAMGGGAASGIGSAAFGTTMLGTFGSFGAGVASGLTGAGSTAAMSGLAANGSFAAAGGMGVGMAIPYIAAAYALYRIISGVGTGRARNPAWQQWGAMTGDMERMAVNPYQGSINNPDARGDSANYWPQLTATIRAVEMTARSLGGSGNKGTQYGMYSSTSPDGKGAQVVGNVWSSTGQSLFNYNHNDSNASAGDRLAKLAPNLILAGLKDSDLPAQMKQFFNSITGDITQDQLNAVVEAATGAHMMAEAFKELGGPFQLLTNLSVDARMGLADLTGGLSAFMQKVQSYYQNFYNDDERGALGLVQADKMLKQAGIDTSTLLTKGDFRDLVNTLDPTVDEDRMKLAALMNAQGLFSDGADLLTRSGGISLDKFTEGAPGLASLDVIAQSGDQTNVLLGGIQDTLRQLLDAIKSQVVKVEVFNSSSFAETAVSEVIGGGGN